MAASPVDQAKQIPNHRRRSCTQGPTPDHAQPGQDHLRLPSLHFVQLQRGLLMCQTFWTEYPENLLGLRESGSQVSPLPQPIICKERRKSSNAQNKTSPPWGARSASAEAERNSPQNYLTGMWICRQIQTWIHRFRFFFFTLFEKGLATKFCLALTTLKPSLVPDLQCFFCLSLS